MRTSETARQATPSYVTTQKSRAMTDFWNSSDVPCHPWAPFCRPWCRCVRTLDDGKQSQESVASISTRRRNVSAPVGRTPPRIPAPHRKSRRSVGGAEQRQRESTVPQADSALQPSSRRWAGLRPSFSTESAGAMVWAPAVAAGGTRSVRSR